MDLALAQKTRQVVYDTEEAGILIQSGLCGSDCVACVLLVDKSAMNPGIGDIVNFGLWAGNFCTLT